MSNGNIYIDCTNGVSGDMLCRCLTDLCGNGSFVEEQQQLISDELHHEELHQTSHELHHEELHQASHDHSHDHSEAHTHGHDHSHDHSEAHNHNHPHPRPYTNRSFQSLLGLLADCRLNEDVKAMTLKIYTILAIAEAQVHEETLETVHFHEVGRPQAVINMVGIAAALTAINPRKVYCSKVIDGIGTVKCAHGEISVPVPAVKAMMNTSNLTFGTTELEMEMVTPTGLAALLAMEPQYMPTGPNPEQIIQAAKARGDRCQEGDINVKGIMIALFHE
jgi:pyridinium-3,5-bisthiocarboxylic acid mononucleotide nickel chelatase